MEDSTPSSWVNSVPQIIANNLRIESLLGRGGMGTVYKATHLSLDRVVAVKIINPEVAAQNEITQRFIREARLMAKLRHPRAAMIYDSGTLPDGRLFIVMEYVEGITLSEVLKKQGRLPYHQAVEIGVSICDVLNEAHSIGIIHRDLKPANIMLNNQGVFVLDFGIAKLLNSDNAESLQLSMTGNGALIGTPYYMSPEQCMGQLVDARSDLYSLGALMFEMLSGRPPFNEEAFAAVIIKHAMVEPPKLEEICPDMPVDLANAVNKLLSKKPEDRPQNAEEARNLLKTSLGEQGVNATTNLPNYPTQNSSTSTVAVTQQVNSLTNSQIPLVSNEKTTNSTKKGFPLLGIIAGGAALLLLISVAAIGGYFFLRSRSNQIVSNNNSANSNTVSNTDHSKHNMNMGDDFVKTPQPNDDKVSAPIISAEEADKVITKITQTTEHRADGMQIIKTPKDSALVCIHNMIEEGKTHMFAVERANLNSQWEITARVSLDVPEFHGANWKFEPNDVDNDGYEEVVFMGTSADHSSHRWLIYVPRTRQNYTVLVTYDADKKITNTTFSPNALAPNGQPFRAALEKMVKEHH